MLGHAADLQQVFVHLCLIDPLPGAQESNMAQINTALTDRMIEATRQIRQLLTGSATEDSTWESLQQDMFRIKGLHNDPDGGLKAEQLLENFRSMNLGDLTILHIPVQNAGVIIQRRYSNSEDHILFEAFEVSAQSEHTLASPRHLVRDFPGVSATISFPEFFNTKFPEEASLFLEKASMQPVSEMMPKTWKAGGVTTEVRDTTSPALITEIFMGVVEAFGKRVPSHQIRKHTWDSVLWSSGTVLPWRRSPFWLVLRVGLQRALYHRYGAEHGYVRYKFLICIVLAKLLEDAKGRLHPTLVVRLIGKLGRRLSKLTESSYASGDTVSDFRSHLFRTLGPFLSQIIENAWEQIRGQYQNFIIKNTRKVPWIPSRPHASECELQLKNSRLPIERILRQYNEEQGQERSSRSTIKVPAVNKDFQRFSKKYQQLSDIEEKYKKRYSEKIQPEDHGDTCEELGSQISSYMTLTSSHYDGDPIQSSYRLLTLMELWVCLDKAAIELFPLLNDYNPCFPPNLLERLQLPLLDDLNRLRRVEKHLRHRNRHCKSTQTIFSDPQAGCFAEKWFDSPTSLPQLHILQQEIEVYDEELQKEKRDEFEKLSARYERGWNTWNENTCTHQLTKVVDQDGSIDLKHIWKDCPKHLGALDFMFLKIAVHEHILPGNLSQKKALLVERYLPKSFIAYRDTTWQLISHLSRPNRQNQRAASSFAWEYGRLNMYPQPFVRNVALGSTTKSFDRTHYKLYDPHKMGLPRFSDACKPNGMRLKYCTNNKSIINSEDIQVSLDHFFALSFPPNSPYASLQYSTELDLDRDGPTSNQVIASQTKCPSGLSTHEFKAFLALASGKERRWLEILLALGSTELNFCAEAVVQLVSRQALQAGPGRSKEPLGLCHSIFSNKSFCERLSQQLAERINNASMNWRETTTMDLLLSIALRFRSLATYDNFKEAALSLVLKIREITWRWMKILRDKNSTANDTQSTIVFQRYARAAAIVCKQTFAFHLEDDTSLGSQCIRCFLEASITLQNNLPVDPSKWPKKLSQKLVRDVKMVHRLKARVEAAIERDLDCAIDVVAEIWPAFATSRSMLSERPYVSTHDYNGWIEIVLPISNSSVEQIISLNWVEGFLLVDGRPIGHIPAHYREEKVLKDLFGDQILRAFPSRMHGMEYVLEIAPKDNQIHLGFRNKELIVRTSRDERIKEFLPKEIFRGPGENFDLPAALIDGCTHWLDLDDRSIEMRRSLSCWTERPGDWRLFFDDGVARRRKVSLVDPASSTFKIVAQIFEHFELAKHITVWRPDLGPLTLRLERLDLSFQASDGTLKCEELQAAVEKDQDIGTWTGLESKLVLKRLSNPRQRIVLVPLGENISYQRRGIHLALQICPNGLHGLFTVNNELGRLESASEPRLFYLKALLHAYTSTALPDRLTGKTGTEEALHCLKSGYCQPVSPLDSVCFVRLKQLACLSPQHYWYPENLKVLERVQWDTQLAPGIQHEAFIAAVDIICKRHERLAQFASSKVDGDLHLFTGDAHLRQRALYRRQRYECPDFSIPVTLESQNSERKDLTYPARDTAENYLARKNMLETLRLLTSWPSRISTTTNLVGLLNGAELIQGFDQELSVASCAVENQLTSGLKHVASDKGLDVLGYALSADLIQEFGPIIGKCRRSSIEDKVHLVFFFALLAYRRTTDVSLLRLFIAFAILEELKRITLPNEPLFTNFRYKDNPKSESLAGILLNYSIPYQSDAGKDPGALDNLRTRQVETEKRDQYSKETQSHAMVLAEYILAQWPNLDVDMQNFKGPCYIDVATALQAVQPILKSCQANLRLSDFIDEVVPVLRKYHESTFVCVISKPTTSSILYPERLRGDETPTLKQLIFKAVSPSSVPALNKYLQSQVTPMPVKQFFQPTRPEIRELQLLVQHLQRDGSRMRSLYVKDLQKSLEFLSKQKEQIAESSLMSNHGYLKANIEEASRVLHDCQALVIAVLRSGNERLLWLDQTGMLPRMTPVSLLELLRSTENLRFSTGMKEALVEYGLAMTSLQRFLRIENALFKRQNHIRLAETNNKGHENWSPLEYTDWLLLEIDANFLLRRRQVEVAKATILPPSGENSLLQLQMGQGKSLCIVPAVSAFLADRKNLLRIVVPRPLLSQTVQAMQQRLGNLVGRSVIHVPFSRRTPTNAPTISDYHNLHVETLESCGIVLTIPEHMMSFKLSGQQRISDSDIGEADRMVKVQQWLQSHCRDILDESDHSLSPKIQLIYPGGGQQSVDGSPQRWEIAQVLLRLTEGHIKYLSLQYEQSIEVVTRASGGLPFLYFLRKDVQDELIALLVKDAEMGAIPSLPLPQYAIKDRKRVCEFISLPIVDKSIKERVEFLFRDNQAAYHVVFLLRGFLVHRLLLMALKRRWNVHYGMHPTREGLSVPFQYKGIPSDTAEWGHPDISILFTCLSFYYGGLNESQLRDSLQVVAKSDNPTGEYEHWIQSLKEIPSSLKDWNAINTEDQMQMSDIHRHVRYSMPAINHYLNTFVFPKYAKQFSTKLQTSSWDLPLFLPQPSPAQAVSHALTTGFSGTTDGKYLFPLNICQIDIPALMHTDAEVLSFLLHRCNRQYQVTRDRRRRRFSERDFLRELQRQQIRVLIDAGAQIMELDNESLALTWLDIDHEAKAAVYFNSSNKLYVIYKNRKKVPLAASPFAENLEDCVVYFAQANCRGSDVPLPTRAHAALTLSLGQTKDATVQAAMRLRLLGVSQSVTWFATPEVHQSILDHRAVQHMSGPIDSAKVISWLLEQSCEGIESLTPLYYSQGKNFCERAQAERENPSFLTSSTQRTSYLKALRQPERQTLKQLYAPRSQKQGGATLKGLDQKLGEFMKNLDQLKKDFNDRTGTAVHSTALEEVEVEREYEHEVEEVREAQKPFHFKPLVFNGLHQNLKTFVETGKLRYDSTAAELAFNMLKRTGPGRTHGIDSSATSSRFLVSTEFCRTVEIPTGQSGDNFLRQPRYLLLSGVSNMAVLVSPEEAEILLGLVRSFPEPKVHLVLYAAPLTRRMMVFNDLDFLSIPPLPPSWKAPLWLKTELGLFAGKLYFSWDEYEPLRGLLGLHDSIEGATQPKAISKKPITLIQELLDLRRKDQDFHNTPMGYIAQGKKLSPEHAFFEPKGGTADVDGKKEYEKEDYEAGQEESEL